MKILLENGQYSDENYVCNVWINEDEMKTFEVKRKNTLILEILPGSDVRIEMQNVILKSKKKGLLIIFYWLLSFVSGCGDYLPFGLPFNALISIKNLGENNIYIKTNSINKKEAFLVETKCNVVENKFVSPKGYKRTWLLGYAMPIFLLILSILLVILLVEFSKEFLLLKGVFVVLISICILGWLAYALFVMKKKC